MEALNIPTGWHQITLKQLADVDAAQACDLNDMHKFNRILAAITDKPLSYIESLPFEYVISLYDKFDWLTVLPTQLIKEFELNGVKYDLHTNIYAVSTGQYAALTECIKKEGYYKLAECAAIMCAENGKKFNAEEAEQRAKVFWESLTCDIVYPLTGFFLSVFEKSQPIFQYSLNQKLKEIQKETSSVLMETELDS